MSSRQEEPNLERFVSDQHGDLFSDADKIADLPAGRDRIIGYVYLDPAFFSKYGSYVLAAFAGEFHLRLLS